VALVVVVVVVVGGGGGAAAAVFLAFVLLVRPPARPLFVVSIQCNIKEEPDSGPTKT
jgi:hypothetical protein